MENKMGENRYKNIRKLSELLRGIKVAMLTSSDNQGQLSTRPVASPTLDAEGILWFFTRAEASALDNTHTLRQISLSYTNLKENRYISVIGISEVADDRAKAEELWSVANRAWFPRGLSDPDLRLMRVLVERAEFWDAPTSAVVQLVGLAASLVTGKDYAAAKAETLNLAV